MWLHARRRTLLVWSGVVALAVLLLARFELSGGVALLASVCPDVSAVLERFMIRVLGDVSDDPAATVDDVPGESCWVPPGGSFPIAGRVIRGGFVYFGSALCSVDGRSVEPSLIDPSRRVDWDRPDRSGSTLGYWPSYLKMTAAQRAGFLIWLGEGRRDPDVGIGFMFVFFYGLERRLAQLGVDHRVPEIDKILDEVGALLDVYGPLSRSFRTYAESLLRRVDAVRLVESDVDATAWDPTQSPKSLPLEVVIGVGRLIAAAAPLPPAWALRLLDRSAARRAMPALRCRDEFEALFANKYREAFGDGLIIDGRGLPEVRLTYRPASAGLSARRFDRRVAVPDVSDQVGLAAQLEQVGFGCVDLLQPLSSYIGRHPDEQPGDRGLEATALLPIPLLGSHGGRAITGMRGWLHENVHGDAPAIASYDVLLQWWPSDRERLSKRTATFLANLLGKLGFGIEPDPRSGRSPTPEDVLALFHQETSYETSSPTAACRAAIAYADLAVLVAIADGPLHDGEHALIVKQLARSVDAVDVGRLKAHLAWLAHQRVTKASPFTRPGDLVGIDPHHVVRLLIDVACVDGAVTPAEVTRLTTIGKRLGVGDGDVFTMLHRNPTHDALRLCDSPPDNVETLALDEAIVERLHNDTAAVAAILWTAADDTDDPAAVVRTIEVPSDPAGLDGRHRELARQITTRTMWDPAELEAVASGLGIAFVIDAIERINDVAVDRCGDVLVVIDDDSFTLNPSTCEAFQ